VVRRAPALIEAEAVELLEEKPSTADPWLDMIADSVGEVIGKSCQEIVDELLPQLIELKSRINHLEATQFKYLGTWKPGRYGENSVITHGGSMWIAKALTDEKPGNGSGWQLCVKRGRGA
jgi:hypothetical protein